MKTLTTLVLAVLLLVFGAVPASAQRLLVSTTLSANLTATDTTVRVTSSTGFVVNQLMFIGSEVMQIRSLNGVAGTSTTITVTRGIEGPQQAHDNTDPIIVSANQTDFQHRDPDYQQDCTRGQGQAAVLPYINVLTATVWNCYLGFSRWTGSRAMEIAYDSKPTVF